MTLARRRTRIDRRCTRKSSSDGSGDSGASTPDPSSGSDPDRPTLHKKTTSDSDSDSG